VWRLEMLEWEIKSLGLFTTQLANEKFPATSNTGFDATSRLAEKRFAAHSG
jgi:hypothetical protein